MNDVRFRAAVIARVKEEIEGVTGVSVWDKAPGRERIYIYKGNEEWAYVDITSAKSVPYFRQLQEIIDEEL